MPYVAPSTVVAGQTYGAAAHNVIVNDVIDLDTRVNDLIVPPSVRVQLNANQATANTTWKIVDTWTEAYDTDGMWTSANNYIEIQTAGIYLVSYNVTFANNGTGGRIAFITLNNSIADGTGAVGSAAASPVSVTDQRVGATFMREFAVADKLRIQVWQSSGGALNLVSTAENFMAATWIGRKS